MKLLEADGKPGRYYVTCRDERGRTAFLLGPFVQPTLGQSAHARALDRVNLARRLADKAFPRDAPWLAYGTSRLDLHARIPRVVFAGVTA